MNDVDRARGAATFAELFAAHAEKIRTGEVIPPHEFERRCLRLRRRGLGLGVARDLWHSGSAELLRRVEAATDEQLRELNAAAAARS